MIQLKRILLPVDFSENADVANNYASALAQQFSAEIHVLHVIEHSIPTFPIYGIDTGPLEHIKEIKKAAEEKLNEWLQADWAKGITIVSKITVGTPFVEIISYAKDQDIDVIIMGTHGRSGLSHLLIGSVAENVVRKAPCPVLTVRSREHQFVMP